MRIPSTCLAAFSRALRLKKSIAVKLKSIVSGGHPLRGRSLPRVVAFPHRESNTNNIGISCIVKNEQDYIGEWLQFHIMQGVKDFIIYDNGCTDDTLEIARAYSTGATCTIVPWRTFTMADEHKFSIQSLACGHALCNFGPRLRWMAFIDIDEFLFSPSGAPLPEILASLSELPAISIPWTNFGPNGHKTKPNGLVIENYTECAQHPLHPAQRSLLRYKSIVDPTEVNALSSHIFPLRDHGVVAFNERGEKIPHYAVTTPSFVATELLRLNHYFTRSLEEIDRRIAKGRVSRNGQQIDNYLNRRLKAYAVKTERDESILQFVPELRRRMRAIEGNRQS